MKKFNLTVDGAELVNINKRVAIKTPGSLSMEPSPEACKDVDRHRECFGVDLKTQLLTEKNIDSMIRELRNAYVEPHFIHHIETAIAILQKIREEKSFSIS